MRRGVACIFNDYWENKEKPYTAIEIAITFKFHAIMPRKFGGAVGRRIKE